MGMYYRVMDEEGNIVYEGEWWDEAMSYVKAVSAGGFVSVLAWDQHYNPKTLMGVFDDTHTRVINLTDRLNILDPEDVPLLTQMGGDTDGHSA